MEWNNIVNIAKKYRAKAEKDREYMFGYPGNLVDRSSIYDEVANIERTGYLANNCGETFPESDETDESGKTIYNHGNYRMNSFEIEREIVDLFAKKFGFPSGYWGYITSGGTESNIWGI